MGINKIWRSTLSFRKFREKTHELSKTYWLQQLGADALLQSLVNKPSSGYTVKELPGSFEFRMYPATVSETMDWIPTYMNRNRLHLLVVYTAFLESYLKSIAFFYVASLGYIINKDSMNETIKLDPIGKAMGSPIIERSTIPDMLKYASNLFGVDFGKNAADWIKIYQLRCEVAHNGGVATPDFFKKMGGMKMHLDPKEFEMLGLTWEELRMYMKAGDDIAATIDLKISAYTIEVLEVEQVMRELYTLGKLPARNSLWQYLHDNYGLKMRGKDKLEVERRFY